jgi:hypothetical protein
MSELSAVPHPGHERANDCRKDTTHGLSLSIDFVDIKIDYGDTSHDTQPASTAPGIVTCTLNFSK